MVNSSMSLLIDRYMLLMYSIHDIICRQNFKILAIYFLLHC